MKHRWRTDLNWLSGVRASQWARLLRHNSVSPTYWHRGAMVSALSIISSGMAVVDRARFGTDFSHVDIQQPLFIVGHWRSGTTWLYHLLARDPGRAAPNAYQAVNPTTFLATESVSAPIFDFLIPDKRIQDDVPLGFHTPEEDEYAIGLLSGCTPYLGRSFPNRLEHYERFLTLRDATDAERAAFHAGMREFMARLTLKYDRPLVLKSPAHTARIRYLLKWFPDAKFVHIHRDPYTVFQSTRHLYDTVDWFWTLQRRPPNSDEVILRQYRKLHQAWFTDRQLLGDHNLVELSYDELVADPMAQVARIYDRLGLGGFAQAQGPMAALLAEQGPYRANSYPPMSAADRAAVREVAGPCFDAWGYPA